ncbi:MAG: hypothetical protein ACI959_001950 [Limisphaerales bacterium]|jgi:uncharacterized protein (DUF58 family)
MDTTELLKKVRKIEIKTRGLSSQLFSGEYHSAFKGRGMSFSEVREYQYGDDIRSIDWNVTARFDTPYVKIFEEERELTVMLLLDLSQSSFFGTSGQTKNDLIAEICAVVSFAAVNNNDKVGCIIFTDAVELFIPPKKGKGHILRIVREILGFGTSLFESDRKILKKEKGNVGTDIGAALEYFNGVIKKRSIVFLFSDFMDSGYETPLQIAARKHDLVGVHIHDAREEEMPNMGIVRLFDPETGVQKWVDTSSKKIRYAYAKHYKNNLAYFRNWFRKCGSDVMSIDSSIPDEKIRQRKYIQTLHQFFRNRERRK